MLAHVKPPAVEILYLASCPHVQPTVDRVREASTTTGIAIDLRLVLVESEEQAHRLRFLGSPSVRVDSRDVAPDAGERDDCGLQCRLYADETGGALHGAPPLAWLRAALLRTRLGSDVEV
jgi:hypothetical protein